MRRRLAIASSRTALALSLVLPLALALAGCGGSDDDSSGPGTTADPVIRTGIDIAWSARTRAFVGPASALSARVTFVGASAASTDVTTTAERRDDPEGYISTYSPAVPVRVGGLTVRVEYFGGHNLGGTRVAVAETGAILKPDGTLSRADGTPLEFVTGTSELGAVAIVAPKTLAVGATATLGFTVTNRQGQTVALTPGSATFRATNGGGFLSVAPDGTVRRVRAGTETVRVEIDGRSAETTIAVAAVASGAVVELSQTVNDLAYSASRNRLLATAPGTAANANRLIEIDPVTGARGQSYAIGSEPGPIGVSANGRIAWVGLSGAGAIRRLDLATGVLGAPVTLGDSGDGAYIAGDLAVSPVDPESVVVSASVNNFQNRLALYRNGVLAPATSDGFVRNTVVTLNAAGTEAFGLSASSNPELTRNAVSSAGVTQTATAAGRAGGDSLVVAGGRLFAANGQVLSVTDLTPVGRFSTTGSTFALDLAARRAYFVVHSSDPNVGGTVLQLETFDTDTYERLSVRTIPIGTETYTYNTARRLVLTGSGRLALATLDGRIVLIDVAKL